MAANLIQKPLGISVRGEPDDLAALPQELGDAQGINPDGSGGSEDDDLAFRRQVRAVIARSGATKQSFCFNTSRLLRFARNDFSFSHMRGHPCLTKAQ